MNDEKHRNTVTNEKTIGEELSTEMTSVSQFQTIAKMATFVSLKTVRICVGINLEFD